MTTPKRAFILAGPNGAGKTTFAREFLVHEASCPAFINADLIAAGLSPFAPERASLRAGRLMLELIDDAVRRGESFAIETTLAGRNYLRAIPEWRARGFFVTLVFVMLPTPEQAIARVTERVRQGGHFIPDATVVRRFSLGLKNLPAYQEIVDAWLTYDGSGLSPKPVAKGGRRG